MCIGKFILGEPPLGGLFVDVLRHARIGREEMQKTARVVLMLPGDRVAPGIAGVGIFAAVTDVIGADRGWIH